MHTTRSEETYLWTILNLSRKLCPVRSYHVVETLGYNKSSVSIALRHLRERGFVSMAKNGEITLTDEGILVAEDIEKRKQLIEALLERFGVETGTAEKEALKLCYEISSHTCRTIASHMDGTELPQT